MPRNTRVVSIMSDGTLIADLVTDFGHYVALILGYKRDEDCTYTYVARGERVLAVWRWER